VRTVAFAVSVEHSRHIAERFRGAGIAAEHLDGETSTDERAAILARLERGETRVVSNCGVLCEGWDQPSVKCCILARPTKSTGLYLQQAGRILRPWTDPETGRAPRAIILDHAGCAVEHGLPQDDREFSLADAPKKSRRDGASRAPAARTCPQCCAVVAKDATACAGCGLSFEREQVRLAVPEEVDGELVEVRRADMEKKRAEWDRLCAVAVDRGFKQGWVYYRYKEQFGVAPPRSFTFPKEAREYSLEEKRAYFEELEQTAKARGYQVGYAFVKYRAKFGEAPPVDFDVARAERVVPSETEEIARPEGEQLALPAASSASTPDASPIHHNQTPEGALDRSGLVEWVL
jgi:superfamily II DNA or RNA helicase